MVTALVIALATQTSGPDLAGLLEKVSARFQALQAYSVEIRQQRFNPGVRRSSARFRVDVEESGLLRFDYGNDAGFAVSDGTRWYHYDASQRTWFSEESGPSSRDVKQRVEHLVGRFAKLGPLAREGTFVRWERVKRPLREIRCAVVDVPTSVDGAKAVDRLWIDPETGLVLRSNSEVFALNDGPQAAGVTVTDYEWVTVDKPESEELFVFVPPKGARQEKNPRQ